MCMVDGARMGVAITPERSGPIRRVAVGNWRETPVKFLWNRFVNAL